MLIIDMPMPKDCPQCPMSHWNKLDEFTGCEVAAGKRYAVTMDKEYAESDCRPDWCPIKGELVRCGECKHCFVDGDNVRFNVCELTHNKVQSDDWFCADGERRSDGEQ